MIYKFVEGCEKNHDDSIDKISELEKKYLIKFPEILKEYYKKYDGEKIILTCFKVNGYECEVAKIVPIIAEKMSFEYIVDNDRTDGFLPADYYPIARDRGGNYYYWSSESGKVMLVLTDDYDNPFEAAASIQDFFAKMNESF